MKTRVHELHPILVHTPLTMLPSAVIVDLASVVTRDSSLDKAARTLWWATAGSGLLAGLAGLASSQEVEAEDSHTRDMMFLHGLGNTIVLVGALGVTAWRAGHRATLGSTMMGLGSLAVAIYTAWLGGEMVYSHAVGMNAPMMSAEELERRSPPLLSRQAPRKLLQDAVKGFEWLLSRAREVFSGGEPINPTSFGVKPVEQILQSQQVEGQGSPRAEIRPE